MRRGHLRQSPLHYSEKFSQRRIHWQRHHRTNQGVCSGSHQVMCGISLTPRRHQLHPLGQSVPQEKWTSVRSTKITKALRATVSITGPQDGVTLYEVTARSMRADGDMALLGARVDIDTIRLVGRWWSDAMLRYLHISAQGFASGLMSRMVQHGDYALIPPSTGDSTPFPKVWASIRPTLVISGGYGTLLVMICQWKHALSHHQTPVAVAHSNNYRMPHAEAVVLVTPLGGCNPITPQFNKYKHCEYQETTRLLVNVTKWMKNHPFLGARLSINFWTWRKIIPLYPASIQKWSGLFHFILSQMLAEKLAPPFVLFVLGSNTKQYLSLCRALIFFFILVHTQVRRVSNYYIIIFIMKKHYFTWTSILNFLTGLLYFFV